jgi:hypothetical protein
MTLETVENRGRALASDVRRLRVAAMSDPERTDELADTLVELTAARLLAWDFAEAAADAPESVVLAARILASRGPSGPYASVPDAVRYATATVQLAAVQAGLGQAAAAGRTLDGLDAWRAQLGRLPLAANLTGAVLLWALLARARALLGTDIAQANAYADAAEARLHALADPPPYLALATHLLAADCRWAAGRPESALAHHRLALEVYRAAVARLDERPRPAVARSAAAPVRAVYEPYAQRLAATGDASGGIVLRRRELSLLERLGDDVARTTARTGLARALASAGRTVEAAELDAVADPAAETPVPALGQRISWEPLPAALALAAGEPDPAAIAAWQRAEQAAVFAGVAARAEAERTESALHAAAQDAAARREAERTEAERRAAAEAKAARAAEAELQRREAEAARARREAEDAAARAAADQRRRHLAEAHERARQTDPRAAEAAAAELAQAQEHLRLAGPELVPQAAARERLADLLRPLALVDPAAHGRDLVDTLEALVGLRWRLGDPDGSREAAREAKALAAELGR